MTLSTCLCNHLGCGIPLLYTFRAATSGRISIDSLAKSVFAMIASSAISSISASNSSCCTDSASNVSSNRASSVMVKSSKLIGLLMVKSSIDLVWS